MIIPNEVTIIIWRYLIWIAAAYFGMSFVVCLLDKWLGIRK